MPVLILDGPEGAGKTTMITAVRATWHGSSTIRAWGPVDGWHVYREPLLVDLATPDTLTCWDRSWASEVVYDRLLHRGRDPDETAIKRELEDLVELAGGLLVMLLPRPSELIARRAARLVSGDTRDLPVDPTAERVSFARYASDHHWTTYVGKYSIPGTRDAIVTALRAPPALR